MNHGLAALLLAVSLVTSALGADKGPEINIVNNKLSIDAQNVPLGRLLRLLDLATGMKSKVPPELANRNISAKFSGLPLGDGVRKIFQGQPFDYVVLEGQGVIVTSAAQNVASTDSAPSYNPPPGQVMAPQPIEQPFTPDFPPATVPQPGFAPQQMPPQQQPPTIQTPFGPIANPRAGQPIVGGAAPAVPPVQQNPLFPGSNPQQAAPQQAAPTPFGTPSPFGQPQTNPNSQNGLFGAPTVFGAPGGAQTK
jgi:hypothetical protein